jgi:hypothetical protein
MTQFPRIKVTTKVAKLFANLALRNKTKDGNYIIWMTDINSVPGLTLADRVSYVGGALLSPMEAKAERNGTANPPATVYTPIYLDKDAEAEASSTKTTETAEGTTDDNSGNTETAEPVVPVTPPVIPDENMSHMPTDGAENQEEQKESTVDNKKRKE